MQFWRIAMLHHCQATKLQDWDHIHSLLVQHTVQRQNSRTGPVAVCPMYLYTIDTTSRNAKTTVGACDALPGFQPTLVGGDGDAVQNCAPITLNLYWSDLSCWAKSLSVTGRTGTPWLSLMKERTPQNCEKSILKWNRHWSSSSLSILTDVNIVKRPLNAALFPGIPSTVQVHDGFRDEHALTAPEILEEVKKLMIVHNTQTVTCVCWTYIKALQSVSSKM